LLAVCSMAQSQIEGSPNEIFGCYKTSRVMARTKFGSDNLVLECDPLDPNLDDNRFSPF